MMFSAADIVSCTFLEVQGVASQTSMRMCLFIAGGDDSLLSCMIVTAVFWLQRKGGRVLRTVKHEKEENFCYRV